MEFSKKYNRAVSVAQTIMEGKSARDAAEEHGIHRNTVTKDIDYLMKYAKAKRHQDLAMAANAELKKRS